MPDVGGTFLDSAQNGMLLPGTTYYIGLNTADPTNVGTTEGGDGRQPITFLSSSGGTQSSNLAALWPTAVGGSTYGWFSIWSDATSTTTYIRGGLFNSAFTPVAGTPVSVASGNITFQDS